MKYEDLLKMPGVRSVEFNSIIGEVPTINMEMDYSTLNILERNDIIQDTNSQCVVMDSATVFPTQMDRADACDSSNIYYDSTTCRDHLPILHVKKLPTPNLDLWETHSITQRMKDALERLTKKENNMIVHVKNVPVETVDNKGVFMSKVNPGIVIGAEGDCLTVKSIIYNNPATIVFWSDGTKTVVKRLKGTPFNKYNAFCAAVCKKLYGSNSALNKIVNSGIDQTKNKKKAGKKKNG